MRGCVCVCVCVCVCNDGLVGCSKRCSAGMLLHVVRAAPALPAVPRLTMSMLWRVRVLIRSRSRKKTIRSESVSEVPMVCSGTQSSAAM